MKLCLAGGFLGSGKTTAILTAARMLFKEKIGVAVITNDQGSQLVDAAFISSQGIPVNEIKNGCFCCNYDQFYLTITRINDSIHPQIIFAEAVGSCADLVATIVKPLFRMNAGIELSLSVFADGPALLSSLEGRSSFVSDNVHYIYKKQLEEAAIIIINKCDLLNEHEIDKINSILTSEYPDKKLLFQDSRTEASVKTWVNVIEEKSSNKLFKALNIDYDKYGAGEAALAWLDATVTIHSKAKAIRKAYQFMNEMFDEISFQKLTIGHLKFFVKGATWKSKISYTSNNRIRANLNNEIITDDATIIVNARVEANPDQLKKIFYLALKKIEKQDAQIAVLRLDSFQPGYPKPKYRLTE